MDFELSEDEKLILDAVRSVVNDKVRPLSTKVDDESYFPHENIEALGELGLFGSILHQEYGGADASSLTYSLILEEIAKACASTSVISSVTTMVGLAIQREGSPEQKSKWIPKIINGEVIGAFCLTESQAGSDPSNMKTKAKIIGDTIHITGQKLWITNASHAGVFLVMAKEDPHGISAFLVDSKSKGITVNSPEKKMGLNGSHTSAVYFDDVEIPLTERLGNPGQGLRIALKSLDTGRIGIASQALGIGEAAFEIAREYARDRVQFGRPIHEFQAVGFRIAEMRMKLDASRLLIQKACWMRDKGLNHTMESSIAKAFSTEAAEWVTSAAIKTLGGMGFSKEFPLERYHRDIQATLIYEGTNDIQRLVIKRSIFRGT